MPNNDELLLNEIFNRASQCDRCGACLLVCPVVKVGGKEMCSPRGMVNAAIALKHKTIGTKETIKKVVDYCVVCGACTEVCPSKIDIPQVILKTREYLFKTTVNNNLEISPNEEMDIAFDNLCELTVEREMDHDSTVAYFFSFEARLSDVKAAASTVNLVSKIANVDLVNNDSAGFEDLAVGNTQALCEKYKNNILLFEDYQTVIVDSAVSYDTLKKTAAYFNDSLEWADRAKAFSAKLISLTEYLVQQNFVSKHHNNKLTYHECYHLGRLQGIKKEPRKLLQEAGSYIELKNSDSCCTGHGHFNSTYPETAEIMLKTKTANIVESGAKIVVTECYECLAQLKKAAEESGQFKAVHISEVL